MISILQFLFKNSDTEPYEQPREMILGMHAKFGWWYAAKTILAFFRKRKGEIKVSIPGYHDKFIIRLGTTDYRVFKSIFFHDAYAEEVVDNPSLILDCGAYVGYSGAFFAKRYPTATVICIEPEGSNYNLLKINTAGYPNIIPLRAALWDRQELLSIQNPDAEKYSFRVASDLANGLTPGIDIPMVLFLASRTKIDILKLDIEGAEKEVFNGSKDWIDRVGLIIAELHDRHKEGCTDAFNECIKSRKNTVTQKGENVFVRFSE
jgi:FkbM family methyltransferase